MISVRRTLSLLFSIAATLAAQNPDFIGAPACGVCHAQQYAAQSRSEHARALFPAAAHPLAANFMFRGVDLGDTFQYDIERRDENLYYRARKGEDHREKVIEWAFGAGQQAVTFVSKLDDDNYVELRTSYYPGSGLASTPGHQNHTPQTADEALGVRYKTFSPRSEILSCFGCHSTGLPSLGEGFAIQPAELGVRCESCHGPGRKHSELIAAGNAGAAREAIGNPARLAATEQMNFCGECHRPPASGDAAIDWGDPWNVRHQPLYLVESSCFLKSQDGLTCMYCHDPHVPLRRNDTAYYNSRCESCHGSGKNPPAEICNSGDNCAICHMPAVQPQRELTFHNHWIGVYAEGKPRRPQR